MVRLKVPPALEQTLRRVFGDDLDQVALEALAVEGYRQAKLTAGEVARLLGLDTSLQAQQWLAARGVPLNYTLDDLDADRAALARHFPEMAR